MSRVVAHVVDGVRVVRRRQLVLQDFDSDFDQGLTETYQDIAWLLLNPAAISHLATDFIDTCSGSFESLSRVEMRLKNVT